MANVPFAEKGRTQDHSTFFKLFALSPKCPFGATRVTAPLWIGGEVEAATTAAEECCRRGVQPPPGDCQGFGPPNRPSSQVRRPLRAGALRPCCNAGERQDGAFRRQAYPDGCVLRPDQLRHRTGSPVRMSPYRICQESRWRLRPYLVSGRTSASLPNQRRC